MSKLTWQEQLIVAFIMLALIVGALARMGWPSRQDCPSVSNARKNAPANNFHAENSTQRSR
ncbi:MAG: hypothetical protein PHV34_00625 [Verrucomicrobiae bacterium]|nr:hypothetical protein [Verrucomicrobiae bacterium]